MAISRAEKRLLRALTRLSENEGALERQSDGQYHASKAGKVYTRLRVEEVKNAMARGLLQSQRDQSLMPTKQAKTWIMRKTTPDENAFGAQHRERKRASFIDAEGRIFQADKVIADTPLSRLRRRKNGTDTPFINAAEYAAAERLCADYHRSSLAQKLCANWEAPARGSAAMGPRNTVLDAADSALDAKDRFMEALAALGPGLDDLIFALCIREASLAQIEASRNWPKRSAKVVIKLALDRLARYYGLV